MIEIDGKIVSTDIITQKFLCDLGRCKGICCVEGNAGAPLEADEARILADQYAAYKPYMTAEGIEAVERHGFSVIDSDGDLTTPLVGEAECAYSYNEGGTLDHATGATKGGVTLCAVERAWMKGETTFRKPVSCHLYPIRVVRFGDGSLGLNYHRWAVCGGALELGREKGVPMFRMLGEAIVRRFGEEFFEALEAAEKYLTAK
ncbi:MAG: DUF3109 family protein [Alistipes sp.]|jgi:hypothetical protein|nr:DUF3109 family protein [Alistipes sp.]